MGRLVDAAKLKKRMCDECWSEKCERRCHEWLLINDAPTVDPVKHGRWMVDEDGNIKCSECGHRGVGDNYCERCGAKMDEVEE